MGRKADAAFVVPLCREHHILLHALGASDFAARFGVNLTAEASRVAALWEAQTA